MYLVLYAKTDNQSCRFIEFSPVSEEVYKDICIKEYVLHLYF